MQKNIFFILSLLLGTYVHGFAETLDEALAKHPVTHPSIMLDEQSIERMRSAITSSPDYELAYQHLITSTDAMCALPPLEREMKGRRMLHSSRTALRRVLHAGVAHMLTGEDRYLQLGKRTLLAAAAFKDWNPSHFLDVAEMSCALGIGYDWFYHHLNDEYKLTIRTALIEKGLKQGKDSDWWVSTNNNWNQVCHAGLSIGALAIRDHEADLAKHILERAIKNAPIAMKVYEPDGAYPEGAGYWIYGTTFNVFLIDALNSSLHSDFGLSTNQAFYKSAAFFRQSFGPSKHICNYADCGTGKGQDVTAAPLWFARELGDKLHSEHQLSKMGAYTAKNHNFASSSDRFFPLLFIWYANELKPTGNKNTQPLALSWHGNGHGAVSFLRTSWEDEKASFAMLKGGSPGDNHAHMDVGSFIFDAKGKRWAADLGKENYGILEAQKMNIWNRKQGSDRWKIYRHSSLSHNILTVDKQQQDVHGRAIFLKQRLEDDTRFSIADLSSVYAGQLSKVQRGVQLFNDGVGIIQDEISNTSANQTKSIRWAMVTAAQITILADNKIAKLQINKENYFIHLDCAQASGFSVQDCTPSTPYEKQNDGYQLLMFTVDLAAAESTTLRVVLLPSADITLPDAIALDSWK